MLPLVNKIRYVNGSAEAIPFKDKSFELVILTNALDHFKDMNKAASEIYRVMKDGGYMLFATYLRVTKPHPWTFNTCTEASNMFPELNVIEQHLVMDNRPYYNRSDLYIAVLKKEPVVGTPEPELEMLIC
jgi:ubiquinone/menaquinone biosynthesis C-methylase UbiE